MPCHVISLSFFIMTRLRLNLFFFSAFFGRRRFQSCLGSDIGSWLCSEPLSLVVWHSRWRRATRHAVWSTQSHTGHCSRVRKRRLLLMCLHYPQALGLPLPGLAEPKTGLTPSLSPACWARTITTKVGSLPPLASIITQDQMPS